MLLNRVATAFALTLASLALPFLPEEGQPRAIRGSKSPESAVVGPDGRYLLVPDVKAGELVYLPLAH
jgi:hypothetical protein